MPLWALGLGAGLISDGDRRRGMWECRCVSVAARVPVRVCDFVCGKTARGWLGLGVTVSRPFVVHSSQAQVGEEKSPFSAFSREKGTSGSTLEILLISLSLPG